MLLIEASHPAGDVAIAPLDTADSALRDCSLLSWLRREGVADISVGHVLAVAELITDWRGQQGVGVPTGRVVRTAGQLRVVRP